MPRARAGSSLNGKGGTVDSPRDCCPWGGRLLAVAFLLPVLVVVVVAASPWQMPASGDQVAVAPEDAAGTAGLDVIEPAPRLEGQPGATERPSEVPVRKRVRDWLFTQGPKKSSGR